jgi:hypothetical protein
MTSQEAKLYILNETFIIAPYSPLSFRALKPKLSKLYFLEAPRMNGSDEAGVPICCCALRSRICCTCDTLYAAVLYALRCATDVSSTHCRQQPAAITTQPDSRDSVLVVLQYPRCQTPEMQASGRWTYGA